MQNQFKTFSLPNGATGTQRADCMTAKGQAFLIMKTGDIVKYSHPTQGEREFRFVLLHLEQGKADIQLICDYAIKPVECVAESEIEPAWTTQKPRWAKLAYYTSRIDDTYYTVIYSHAYHCWCVEDNFGAVWGNFKTAQLAMRAVENLQTVKAIPDTQYTDGLTFDGEASFEDNRI